ncbi:hypothetical protein [Paenibacillus gansuensis]|uniref:Uncharacterized protein n=1 Tax=Paenibacillus gansuensis TaxID=306542 RepID=A0ABW5PB63_9BACL
MLKPEDLKQEHQPTPEEKANMEMGRLFNGRSENGTAGPDMDGFAGDADANPPVNPQSASGINRNMS